MNTLTDTLNAAAAVTLTAVTAEAVKVLLATRPAAVERAILALYEKQTSDEQVAGVTTHHNDRGFNASDAKRFSFLATFLLSGKHLKAETCARYAPRLMKYAGQLARIANAKRGIAEPARATRRSAVTLAPVVASTVTGVPALAASEIGGRRCPDCDCVRCPDGCCCGC